MNIGLLKAELYVLVDWGIILPVVLLLLLDFVDVWAKVIIKLLNANAPGDSFHLLLLRMSDQLILLVLGGVGSLSRLMILTNHYLGLNKLRLLRHIRRLAYRGVTIRGIA